MNTFTFSKFKKTTKNSEVCICLQEQSLTCYFSIELKVINITSFLLQIFNYHYII